MRELFCVSLICFGAALSGEAPENYVPMVVVASAVAVDDDVVVAQSEPVPAVIRTDAPSKAQQKNIRCRRSRRLFNRRSRR